MQIIAPKNSHLRKFELMITAEDIRSTRTALAITQDEMARALSVTRRTLQNWERGEKIPSTKQNFLASKLKEMLEKAGLPSMLESEKDETERVPKGFVEVLKKLTEAHSEQTRQVTELIELLKNAINGRKATEQDS